MTIGIGIGIPFVKIKLDWTPSNIITKLWFDAADVLTLNLDGTKVTQWDDKSGNNCHATQGTGSYQPTYDSVNSRIDFDGSNDILDVACNAIARNVGELNCFAVVQYNSQAVAGQAVFFASRGDSNTSARYLLGNGFVNGTEGFQVAGRRLDTDSFKEVSNNSKPTGVVLHHGRIDYSSSNAYNYINGALDASDLSFQTDGNTQDNDSLQVKIGGIQAGGSNFNGKLHELILVGAMDADTIAKMNTYLANKWSIILS